MYAILDEFYLRPDLRFPYNSDTLCLFTCFDPSKSYMYTYLGILDRSPAGSPLWPIPFFQLPFWCECFITLYVAVCNHRPIYIHGHVCTSKGFGNPCVHIPKQKLSQVAIGLTQIVQLRKNVLLCVQLARVRALCVHRVLQGNPQQKHDIF